MKKRNFYIGALSDIGYVKKINQDRILVKIGEDRFGEFGLFVVADGMGGLDAGDKASELVIKQFINWWDNNLSSILKENQSLDIDMVDGEFNNLIFNINNRIIEFGRLIGGRLGTTLSMLFIYKNEYIIKHIGDSRIYKINEDITKLTEDHSWIEKQIKEGKINRKEAVKHPKRHVLLQCIGVKKMLNIFEDKGEAFDGDTFLLCSDGFYKFLKKDEMLNAVKKYKKSNADIQIILEGLMEKVKARGALDNASATLIYPNYDEGKRGILNRLKELIS